MATKLSDRTVNSAGSPCASCKVRTGSLHKESCTGGQHTPFLDWAAVLRRSGRILVDHINHNEILYAGRVWYLGYTSRRSEFEGMGAQAPHWFVYKSVWLKVNSEAVPTGREGEL